MEIKKIIKRYIKESYPFIFYKVIRLKIAEIKNEKHQETGTVEFYSQFLKAKDLCFDIGANIGNKSAVLKRLGCKVIAVEPQEYCVKFLKMRFGKKVIVVNKAIDEVDGMRELNISDADTLSSLSTEWINTVKGKRFSKNTWGQKKLVSTTTLDNLIKKYGVPKYCKIDVEGYEYKVLNGLNQKIEYISFEFAFPESLDNTISILKHLKDLGDFECNYSETETSLFKFNVWISQDKFLSLLNNQENFLSDWGDIFIRFNYSNIE
jgi:FkbM family methyltransferase